MQGDGGNTYFEQFVWVGLDPHNQCRTADAADCGTIDLSVD